jgi:hypothetical protein
MDCHPRRGAPNFLNALARFFYICGGEKSASGKPFLALAFERDGFAPLAVVRNLCRKMRQAKVRLVHLDQAAMNGRGFDHFGWVKHAAPVVDNICDWIACHPMTAGKKGS